MPKPGLHQLAQSAATDKQVPNWDNTTGLWKPRTTVHTITPGAGVVVDTTDPFNPVVSLTLGAEFPMVSIDENGFPGLVFDEFGHIYYTEDT